MIKNETFSSRKSFESDIFRHLVLSLRDMGMLSDVLSEKDSEKITRSVEGACNAFPYVKYAIIGFSREEIASLVNSIESLCLDEWSD
jgi:hypothetical protein